MSCAHKARCRAVRRESVLGTWAALTDKPEAQPAVRLLVTPHRGRMPRVSTYIDTSTHFLPTRFAHIKSRQCASPPRKGQTCGSQDPPALQMQVCWRRLSHHLLLPSSSLAGGRRAPAAPAAAAAHAHTRAMATAVAAPKAALLVIGGLTSVAHAVLSWGAGGCAIREQQRVFASSIVIHPPSRR
jgi:hypothetical protein